MPKVIIPILLSFILISTACKSTKEQFAFENELKEFTTQQMEKYKVPGLQISILDKKNNRELNLAFGVSDLVKQSKLKTSNQIKVGSMTKSFTAISILKLAEKDELNLDDTFGKYFSFVNEPFKDITIKKLMNMHSGLKGYVNDDESDKIIDAMIADPSHQFKPEELVKYGIQLTEELGETGKNEFHYTNTNYIILGMIIEKVSGKSYKQFVESEIIKPLELNSTFIPENNKYNSNVSSGYYIDFKADTMANYSSLDLSYVWSAGTIISNAENIAKWISSVAEGKLLGSEYQKYVFSGLKLNDGVSYTSGLIKEPDMIWHNGTVLGYHGEMRYLIKENIAIVILSNCSIAESDSDPVKNILNKIEELLNRN